LKFIRFTESWGNLGKYLHTNLYWQKNLDLLAKLFKLKTKVKFFKSSEIQIFKTEFYTTPMAVITSFLHGTVAPPAELNSAG